MKESTVARGTRGEVLAEAFLRQKGYHILVRNYRDNRSRCEIDLIVRQGNEIVFVEVKSGTGTGFGPPQSWVREGKQRRIARAARRFLQERRLYDMPCRFDVIGIDLSQHPPSASHIERAFWSEY